MYSWCIIIPILRYISLLMDVLCWYQAPSKHYKETESAAKAADDTFPRGGQISDEQHRKRGAAGKGGQRMRRIFHHNHQLPPRSVSSSQQ